MRRLVPFLVLFVAGCSEDLLNPSGDTSITGRTLISGSEQPVADVGIGLVFHPVVLAGSPASPGQVLGPLRPPYPNPLASGSVILEVTVAEPPGGTVQVTAANRSLPGVLAVWGEDGLLEGVNQFTWDGRDQLTQQVLPNGMYYVDFLAPEGALLDRQSLLINRPVTEVIAQDVFNTWSDPDGRFRIFDVPVGEGFTATEANGVDLGERVLDDRVTLFPDDTSFRHQESNVRISPREVVTVDLFLIPFAAPGPGSLALTP